MNTKPPNERAASQPSPNMVNGAAMLASGLAREALVLAETAAALRTSMQPLQGEYADVRRQKTMFQATSDAAIRAAMAFEICDAITTATSDNDRLARIQAGAKRAGLPASIMVPMLRAAALRCVTHDEGARIAAFILAEDIATSLSVD